MFLLVFNNTTVNSDNDSVNSTNNKVVKDSPRKYFLSRIDVTGSKGSIDGKTVYDQSINDQIKHYDKIKKLQQDREMITQQNVYQIINTSKIIIN